MRKLFFLICFDLLMLVAKAQSLSFQQKVDSLQKLGSAMVNNSDENERISSNYKFIKLLAATLKESNSYNYNFEELEHFISIKISRDNKFRIFSWFVYKDEGTYRYFGAIQQKDGNLIPLIDDTDQLKLTASVSSLEPNHWFGAVYYDIIPVLGKKNYYLLLGWKGVSPQSSSKVIEVLSLEKNQASLGLPVLESEASGKIFYHRKIFDFDSQASMMLRYDEDKKLIVFDHLVPPGDDQKAPKNTYVPDLSYDAYRYRNGKWVIEENVPLKNRPRQDDDMFLDPAKITPSSVPIRQY